MLRLRSTSNKYFCDCAIEKNVEGVRRFSFAWKKYLTRDYVLYLFVVRDIMMLLKYLKVFRYLL